MAEATDAETFREIPRIRDGVLNQSRRANDLADKYRGAIMSSTETFHVTQEIEGDECIVGTCERFANAVIMARAEVKLGQVGICVTSTTRGILVVYDKDGRETLGRPVTAEEKAAVADTASRCLRGGDPS